MIHSLADQRGSQATVAIEALANRGMFNGFTFREWNAIVSPSKGAVGNPSSFAIGRGYPNLDAGVAVLNLQSPFGFQLGDVAVVDHRGLNWIDYNEVYLSQNEFWSNPEQVSDSGQGDRNQKIKHTDTGLAWVENRLNDKKCVECESHTGPHEISLGAKNSVHASIIAAAVADGRGN